MSDAEPPEGPKPRRGPRPDRGAGPRRGRQGAPGGQGRGQRSPAPRDGARDRSGDGPRERGAEDRGPARPSREGERPGPPRVGGERRGPQGEVGEGQVRRPVRRPAAARRALPKPPLPQERPRLQREAYRELRASVPPARFEDVARAYGAAGEALEEGEPGRALPYLEWAKDAAPRSSSVREALGIARYLTGDYAAATSELTTYRRLSGREDQNHLLADSARALGRPERVGEYVSAMERAGVDRDRVVEGLIVLSGERSDRGDDAGALAVLERAELRPHRIEPWHPRVWYAAAALAERLGDVEAAREYLEAVTAVDEGFLDAEERLRRLGGGVSPPGAPPGSA